MEKLTYKICVLCPSRDDFAKNYPQYAPFAHACGSTLFDLIVKPESFVQIAAATDLGFAAVYGIAKQCSDLIHNEGRSLDSFTKQFIGAVVCCMMENNQYKKTGKKKAINHPDFSKGEIYEKI